MPFIRIALIFMTFVLPATAAAQVTQASLPGEALWYLHADLEELRDAQSGRHLYQWLEKEVFHEIFEELGIDLSKEASRITAFADASLGTVIVVDGAITETTRDKLLALASMDSKLDTLKHGSRTFYHAERKKGRFNGNRSFDDLEKNAYFSFDVKNKLIVASDPDQMKALLESGGRLPGSQSRPGTLLVLTADKSFVQAGVRTAAFADDDDRGWDSNILRNTELVALLVSDRNGHISVEAQLVSQEAAMTQSLGGIINGLISLQALSSDLDPDILALIRNTKIDVKDKILSINAVISPEMIVKLLDD